MNERQTDLDRSRARLELWEDRLQQLRNAPAFGTESGQAKCDAYTQELSDRMESVRVKIEKLARIGPDRRAEAREELNRAFAEVQTAWDTTVARIACGLGTEQ